MKFHFQIVTGLILSLFILAEAAESVVPFFANYRGRLVDDSGAPLTGSYSITFNLYTQPLGGVAVWTETHTGVAVSDGLFTVGLGTLTPLAGIEVPGDEFWIGITVGSDPELAPRTRVLSTFFAFSAGKADYADTAGFSNVADRA
ncbi:MAG: hypothetical protein ACE5GA_09415, partial [Candidatus Zixiibacteriota bacterium]